MRFALLTLLALCLVLFGVGHLAPQHTVVAREIEVAAAPADVIGLVSNLERWSEWSPMFAAATADGTAADLDWGDLKSGLGAQVQLDFGGEARALLTVVDADPESGVWIETRSGRPTEDLWNGEGFRAGDWIDVESTDAGCRVTWTRRGGEVASPWMRLFDYVAMRPKVGRQLEGELAGLADHLER